MQRASPLLTWRTKEQFTQPQMARLLGVSVLTYSYWERGISGPNDDNRESLAELVGWQVVQEHDKWRREDANAILQ